MSSHINTSDVPAQDIERGARQESYARMLAQWRAGEITDEQWEQMRRIDPEFSRWLWKIGAI